MLKLPGSLQILAKHLPDLGIPPHLEANLANTRRHRMPFETFPDTRFSLGLPMPMPRISGPAAHTILKRAVCGLLRIKNIDCKLFYRFDRLAWTHIWFVFRFEPLSVLRTFPYLPRSFRQSDRNTRKFGQRVLFRAVGTYQSADNAKAGGSERK